MRITFSGAGRQDSFVGEVKIGVAAHAGTTQAALASLASMSRAKAMPA